eukprot:scaffold68144_cov73-Phaeocystis_antarctica.AAC.7
MARVRVSVAYVEVGRGALGREERVHAAHVGGAALRREGRAGELDRVEGESLGREGWRNKAYWGLPASPGFEPSLACLAQAMQQQSRALPGATVMHVHAHVPHRHDPVAEQRVADVGDPAAAAAVCHDDRGGSRARRSLALVAGARRQLTTALRACRGAASNLPAGG